MKQSRIRRLSCTLLALAALAGAHLAVGLDTLSAQTTLRWGRHDPGNTKPILLHADEVTVWPEPDGHVFLLRGRVWIDQGLVQLRSQQAVVWVDEQARKRTGTARVEVYAEGDVVLEEGARAVTGQGPAPRALIELTTRGEVGARSYNQRIHREPARNDPLYLSALTEKQGPASQAASLAGAAPEAPPMRVDPALQRVSAQESQPLPPGVVAPPPAGNPAPLPVPPVPPAPVQRPQPPGAGPDDGTETPPPPRPVPPLLEAETPPQVIIRPRSSLGIKSRNFPLPTGETAVVITSGVIITVTDKKGLLDVEADRAVVWMRGDFQQLFKGEEAPGCEQDRHYEFYLSGHVELRQQSPKGETTLLRADEVYYDVARGVAVAREADLELTRKGMPEPLHLQGPEILQINPKLFQLPTATINASKLPYDPNLKLTLGKASLEEIQVPKRGLFGLGPQRTDPKTGEPVTSKERLFRGRNVVLWLGGVPVFYLPYIQGDADDPLGPLEGLAFNYNRIFGFQTFLTLDFYDLLGLTPTPGTKWRLHTDYMTERGPALGTDYIFTGRDLFGVPSRYNGLFKVYGIHDTGTDVLGGDRGTSALTGGVGQPFVRFLLTHPEYRGWGSAQLNVQELPYGFTLQGKLNAISDRNFQEQFFHNGYYNDLDSDTWLYLKQQQNNWMWSFLVQPRLRNWMTETEYLPSLDGVLLGQKLFDLVTWNLSGSAAYAHLLPSHQPPPAYTITDQGVGTGRFDVANEVSLPFALGDFKVVPYLVGDFTYYTQDLTGDDRGRVYGGGGVRSSLGMSRLFPGVESELFNLNGIYHKIVFSSNYYNVHSDTSFTQLPQLDRLNEAVTDRTLRDIRSWQQLINPGYGLDLVTNPAFDPQTYAIRRLIENRIDTRDSIEVLQVGMRQRLQTKRGYPGQQHIVDWMTLDLTASYFPSPVRDNFGQSFSFLQYDYNWFLGDRFTVFSDGWYEPLSHGARVFGFGFEANRPDRNSFTMAYRSIDPVRSRTVLAAFTYVFSPKYRITAAASYDFLAKIQVNTFTLTRVGTDLQVSLGVTQNSILNTFGFTFEVFPNLLPESRRVPGSAGGFMQSLNSPR